MIEITHPNQLHEVTCCDGGDGSSEWETYEIRADDNCQYWIGTDSGCSCNNYLDMRKYMGYWTGPLTLEQTIEEFTSLLKLAEYCDSKDLMDALQDLNEYDREHHV